jgi:hexosaminidase
MPGHSRAAIRSMEVRYRRLMAKGDRAGAERHRLVEPGDTTRGYSSVQHYDDNTLNVCIDSTYRFIDTVIDAIAGLHKQAGVLTTYCRRDDGGRLDPVARLQGDDGQDRPATQAAGRLFHRADFGRSRQARHRGRGVERRPGPYRPRKDARQGQTNIWSNLHAGGVAGGAWTGQSRVEDRAVDPRSRLFRHALCRRSGRGGL